MNSDDNPVKVLATCTQCGTPQGIFDDEDEMRLSIAEKKKCDECGSGFRFLEDLRIWNLRWEVIPVKPSSQAERFVLWDVVHPDITRVAQIRYEAGQYADSVESAFKEVNKRVKGIVKAETGAELDGKALMHKAFTLQKPVIVLDDLGTQTGRDVQEGYMHIFAGAMQGIRNPKAHDNIEITEERAIHFILLASLLMHKLDEVGV